MDRFQVSFNANTGFLFFGELNEKLSGAVFDKAHAVRVLSVHGFAVATEWLPSLAGTGYTTFVSYKAIELESEAA